MKKTFKLVLLVFCAALVCSCTSSKAVLASGVNLSKYEYVVFGDKSSGDRELDDVLMLVQNAIADTRLTVVSAKNAISLIADGKYVLTPHINVKSEKWEGGYTYITLSFYDYDTNQSLIVIKSQGIGMTVSHDQKIALKSITKKLQEVF